MKHSWLRNLFTRSAPRPIRKSPPRFRPVLETLEDRCVPSTFTVIKTVDDGSVGTLRWAVGQANLTTGANTINFSSTVFNTLKTINLAGTQLELSDTTGTETITGPAAGVKVNGGGLSRVFQVDTLVTASFSGLTITGGKFVSDGSFVGGGGVNNSGSLAMTNCTVSGNSAFGLGGGGGGFGGGVNNSGSLAMTNCTVSGNTVAGVGGGVSNFGSVAMTNCTSSGNYATGGGGFYDRDGTATLTNCTVSGNLSSGAGGLFCVGGAITVGNTIVAGNNGGGFYGADLGTFLNGVFISQGNNLIGETDGSSGWVSSDLTGTSALPLNAGLAPLGNYGGPTQTMPLLYGSPAINAGSNALIPSGITTDQRGDTRIVNGTVDIGAYELQSVIVPSFVVTTTADFSDPTDGQTSLREAIASANAIPGHTITFNSSVFNTLKTITLTGAPLELGNTSGTERIAGPTAGVTVNGGALTGAFQVADLTGVFQVDKLVTASISGLTITGGYSARYSGGAGVNNSGSLTMTHCTVSGNFANNSTEGGGGVLNSGTLAMTNCTVSGNDAIYGGGVENSGTLAMTNCTVSGNLGYFGGGGVDNTGALAMTSCTVSGNSARYFGGGGGVFNSGSLAMTNCTVSGNSANSYYQGGGGVNNLGSLAMTNCTVSGNAAILGGGVNNSGSLALTNCYVHGNSAVAGGGISNQGTLNVAFSVISNNQSTSAGGGISTTGGSATITFSIINANQVNSTGTALGGGIDCENSLLTLTFCTVNANQANGATALGGGIYALDSTVDLYYCTVIGNHANGSVLGEGGGIYSDDSLLTLVDSIVIGNHATTDHDNIFD